jgi:hypothetical protein
MEYRIILAQTSQSKNGFTDWVELRGEMERKINNVLLAVSEYVTKQQAVQYLTAEQYKMVLVGGINTTFEISPSSGENTVILQQAVLIPKEVAQYLDYQHSKVGTPNETPYTECFDF